MRDGIKKASAAFPMDQNASRQAREEHKKGPTVTELSSHQPETVRGRSGEGRRPAPALEHG